MHQIGSGMYVSGRAPDRKRERKLSSGSVATPPYTGGDVSRSDELGRIFDVSSSSAAPSPASSSRRSSGPLPPPLRPPPSPALSQLSHSGLLVGPSPPHAPSPARGGGSSWRKPSRMRAAAWEEAAAAPVVARGSTRLGVPFACYVLVAVAAAAGVGAGVFFLVSWRRGGRRGRVLLERGAVRGRGGAVLPAVPRHGVRPGGHAHRRARQDHRASHLRPDPRGSLLPRRRPVRVHVGPDVRAPWMGMGLLLLPLEAPTLRGAVDEFLHLRPELREEVLRARRGRRQDQLDDQAQKGQLRRRQQGRVEEPEELVGEPRRVLRRRRARGRRVHQGGGHGERDRRAEEAPRLRRRRRARRRGGHRLPAGEVHVPRARRGAGAHRQRGPRRGRVHGLTCLLQLVSIVSVLTGVLRS